MRISAFAGSGGFAVFWRGRLSGSFDLRKHPFEVKFQLRENGRDEFVLARESFLAAVFALFVETEDADYLVNRIDYPVFAHAMPLIKGEFVDQITAGA